MKTNKKIVSVASVAALVLNLFLPAFAWAYTFSVPSLLYGGSVNIDVNEILQEANQTSISSVAEKTSQSTEERYGFDEDLWLRAKRKETAPRVEIFFDNTNPKPGEKVTAHVVPEFFKNDPQNLYYTWYLIHTKDGTIKTATNSIRDGKIEASRIMARGDYDPDLDRETYDNSDKDPDKDGWPAIDSSSYDETETAAPMGGSDGVGGLPEETVDSFSSATEYCDSLGDYSWSNCSFFDGSGYKPLNTYYTPQSTQANHYCNLCKNYFSGDGSSSYTSAKTARNNCCYTNTPESSLQCSSTDPDTGVVTLYKCPQVVDTDYCNITYNSLFDGCYDAFKESNKSTITACLDSEYSSCKTDWATVHEDTDGDGFSDVNEEDTTRVSRCYKHNFGTNKDAEIFRQNDLSDSTTKDMSGLDVSVSCKHKWENATDYKSGSGKFPTGEEEKWKTDPTDPDTDGDGFVDEADVIGLGQQEFTWTYQSGDRIGVVVEGTSMIPTDEKNAYYKIMWGHLDVCDGSKTGLMDGDGCDDSGDYGYGFLATKAPNELGEERLKVSLSFSPDNPVANPSDANKDNIEDDGTILDADQATIISSIENTNSNPNALYYTWQISEGSLEKDDWKEIKSLKDSFNLSAPSSGVGVAQFSFTPKKDALEGSDDIVYFKVTLTVSQASGIDSGRGRSSVVIPYNKNGVKISLHKVDIEDGKATIGEEVCDEGLYVSLCPAVKGQMLAAKVSGGKYKLGNAEFSWTVNGNPLYPPTDASSFFEDWNSTSAFFPITKQEREIEEISVTAIPKDELKPVTGARLVTVVYPAVFIKSSDESVAWPTTYTAENPMKKQSYFLVESSNSFNALTSSNPSFYLDFVPYYLLGNDENTQIDWQVNGTSLSDADFYETNPNLGLVELENDDRTLKIPTGESEGVYYDLSAEIKKYWSDDERGISYTVWGVIPQALEGKTSATVATIAYSPYYEEEIGSKNPKQILAAIGTNLPHYFMYILRLALTMAIMFFTSFVLYGLTQKIGFKNEE